MSDLPVRGESRPPAPEPNGDAARNGPWPRVAEGLPDWEAGIPWRRYLAALGRYRWMVVGIVAIGTAVGAGLSQRLPARYRAEATIWIDQPDPRAAERGPIGSGELLKSYAWVDLVKSYVVLDDVVRDLRLYILPRSREHSAAFESFRIGPDSEYRPGKYRLEVDTSGERYTLRSADGLRMEAGRVGEPIGRAAGFEWRPSPEVLPAGAKIRFTVTTPRDGAQQLAEALEIRLDPSGSFLRVELEGRDPQRIAQVLNRLTERAVEVATDLKRAKVGEVTRILAEQRKQAEADLRDAEAALEEFGVRTVTLPSSPSGSRDGRSEAARDPVFGRFFDLELELEQVRRDRAAIERALRGDAEVSLAALEAIPSVQRSSEMRSATEELAAKRAELRRLRDRYTDEYPAVQRLIGEIDVLERQTLPSLAASLLTELAARESRLEADVRAASAELRGIPPRAVQEARLRRRLESAEEVYTTVQERYEAARLAAASSVPDIQVLDRAVVPQRPVNERMRWRLASLAFLGSLGLALAMAILRDRLDHRVREPADVTKQLGLTILGAVPRLRDGRRGEADALAVREAFRVLRLNVAHAHGAAGPVLLTVSSPGMGDGKSFVSAHLARAFAELGQPTLLIDGDIRRGVLHERVGGERKPGLTDFLAGPASVDRIARATDHPSLHLIASGSRMERGPELLASPAMRQLIADVRSIYSVILVDSPPLGAGADPFLLGSLTTNLLLVLRAGTTDSEWAEAKLHLLERLPIRILGAILNDVPVGGLYRAYGYLPGYAPHEETASSHGSV